MTKTNIIDAVAKKTGLKKKDVEASVNAFIEVIGESIAQSEKVQIVGFGTFEVKERAARTARNPRTGEAIDVGPSKHISFAAGKSLKDSVN
ncbi:MAG: HU family DNA-binding protein [Oscillospiraceae bacterium]|nr:HU family DNA-binding protein [Oscillospiraceae bacterium]